MIPNHSGLIVNVAILIAAAVAAEYGFTDIDGKQPRPFTLSDV